MTLIEKAKGFFLTLLEKLKKEWFEIPDKANRQYEIIEPEPEPERPPLTAYEVRRIEIAESTEPIEGIFYLLDGQIIPDYYSECLFSDKTNPLREAMYHTHFYPYYMMKKYDGLTLGEKSLPRGRISGTATSPIIYIDRCYFENRAIIIELIDLYRLPEKIDLSSHSNYLCPACYRHRNEPPIFAKF